MEAFNYDEINTLIANCLSGSATGEDLIRLNDWVNSAAENRQYYQRMKNIWDISHTRVSFQDIHAEKAYTEIQRKLTRVNRRSFFIGFFQRAAAVIFIPMLIGSYFLGKSNQQYDPEASRNMVYNEVSAAFGTRSMLTLGDGSRVWLNAGSKLKYPNHFEGSKREVYLTGEGYFEVESNVSKPFIVHTSVLNVRATGTRFNVNASGFDNKTLVTLLSGKVTVCKNIKGAEPVEITKLHPNQHLSFDTLLGSFDVKNEDTYKYIAWKDGKMIFRNEPLEEVIKKIGYYYNVEIELRDEKLKEYRYRATFEEESIYEILELLKLSSPVDYREIKRMPLPDGSFPKKKIVLFPADKNPI